MKYFIPSKKTHPIFSRALSFLFISFSFVCTHHKGALKKVLPSDPLKGFGVWGTRLCSLEKFKLIKRERLNIFNFNPTFSFGFEYPFRENLFHYPRIRPEFFRSWAPRFHNAFYFFFVSPMLENDGNIFLSKQVLVFTGLLSMVLVGQRR